MKKSKRRYNWRPDQPDFRDHLYTAKFRGALPSAVDLRSFCSPVENQGRIGSCTGNALAGLLEFLELREIRDQATRSKFADMSRLFIYYNERAREGTTTQDAGASLRDGIKTLAANGACTEATWPYLASKVFTRPSVKAYAEAKNHRISEYTRLSTLDEMKGCLAEGFPFVFGITVYESFESATVARTGVVPMPSPDERPLGGHAILAVGYDDRARALWVRNSWGASWGLGGYFKLPYAYVSTRGLAQDFWTVRK